MIVLSRPLYIVDMTIADVSSPEHAPTPDNDSIISPVLPCARGQGSAVTDTGSSVNLGGYVFISLYRGVQTLLTRQGDGGQCDA